jgi:hypothetical protein
MPKFTRYSNKVFKNKYGNERIEELISENDINTTFLPPAISISDIDIQVNQEFNQGRLIVVSASRNEQIGAFLMGNDKWSQFSKTWQYTDDDKNVILPIIIIRKTDTKYGSRLGDNRYYVSNKKTYEYSRVPFRSDSGEIGFLIYKIPNPTPIDITYEISLITKFTRDLNNFDNVIIRNFQDRQLYINVKGSYMPLTIESSSDDSVNDLDGNNYIIKNYTMLLRGMLLNENEFETYKSYERVVKITEINNEEIERKKIQLNFNDPNKENNVN